MIVAPITFPWADDPPYAWAPKRQRDGSVAYWAWAMEQLTKAGCNAVVMLMGSSAPWQISNANLSHVLRIMRVPIIPYFAKASFTRWGWPTEANPERPYLPPDPKMIGEEMQGLLGGISDWRPCYYRTGAPVMGFLGNVYGLEDLAPDWLYEAIPDATWFVDRHTIRRYGTEHAEQINLFTQPGHLYETGKTAAIRPGFLHGAKPDTHRFVPRQGGKWWRAGLRAALANPELEFLFIESEGEIKEGTSILKSRTRQLEPARSVHPDRWGATPGRYLRILKRELRRAGVM